MKVAPRWTMNSASSLSSMRQRDRIYTNAQCPGDIRDRMLGVLPQWTLTRLMTTGIIAKMTTADFVQGDNTMSGVCLAVNTTLHLAQNVLAAKKENILENHSTIQVSKKFWSGNTVGPAYRFNYFQVQKHLLGHNINQKVIILVPWEINCNNIQYDLDSMCPSGPRP